MITTELLRAKVRMRKELQGQYEEIELLLEQVFESDEKKNLILEKERILKRLQRKQDEKFQSLLKKVMVTDQNDRVFEQLRRNQDEQIQSFRERVVATHQAAV